MNYNLPKDVIQKAGWKIDQNEEGTYLFFKFLNQ